MRCFMSGVSFDVKGITKLFDVLEQLGAGEGGSIRPRERAPENVPELNRDRVGGFLFGHYAVNFGDVRPVELNRPIRNGHRGRALNGQPTGEVDVGNDTNRRGWFNDDFRKGGGD